MQSLFIHQCLNSSHCSLHSVLDFLLAMHNLTDIEWYHEDHPEELDDDGVEKMAVTWKHLHKLRLRANIPAVGFARLATTFPELAGRPGMNANVGWTNSSQIGNISAHSTYPLSSVQPHLWA
jgi:hypothetical protein